MSFHCSCYEELEKTSGLKIDFDIILKISGPGVKTRKTVTRKTMSLKGSGIVCPFCGNPPQLSSKKEAPMKK